MDIKELDNEYVAHAYGRFDVCLTQGKGSTLYDDKGKKYIDFGSGIGVTAFSICDEIWKDAVIEQLSKVQHTSNLYYTYPSAELAKLLCEKTGMKKVFFGNSGAEANEGAIKFARKYSFDKYGEGRYDNHADRLVPRTNDNNACGDRSGRISHDIRSFYRRIQILPC